MAGIYIHIPFCKHKCAYCNFFSVTGNSRFAEYAGGVVREMALQKDYLQHEPISTLYLGGGTPSLMPLTELTAILRAAYDHFIWNPHPEITLEANPEQITPGHIRGWADAGVNRLSLGIQSLHDDCLRFLGRTHNASLAWKALELTREMKLQDVSADLIFGIPGQTDEMLRRDLERLCQLEIPHLSVYALTSEEKTPLSLRIRQGKIPATDEEQQARQFLLCSDLLTSAGYEQYEISNYAIPGRRSQHNSGYWNGYPYLGLGPSAHSFNGNSRQWNPADLKAYLDAIGKGTLLFEREILTQAQRLNEYLMTALRKPEGVDLIFLENTFGPESRSATETAAEKYILNAWLETDGNFFKLTRQGKLFADLIASALMQTDR